MKNKYLVLVFIALLLTGCSFNNINSLSNDEIVDKVLNTDTNKTNTALEGYKLYIPKGITITKDNHNNTIFSANEDKYYLYVDLVSYYNKINNDYKINNDKSIIYSKEIEFDNKKGYILVTEIKDKYFIEVMYNYAKIEVISKDIKRSIASSLIILKNINYNDKVIETLVGDNVLTYDEEQFKLLGPNNKNDNFLKYEEEYGTFEDVDNELPDEDKINIKE